MSDESATNYSGSGRVDHSEFAKELVDRVQLDDPGVLPRLRLDMYDQEGALETEIMEERAENFFFANAEAISALQTLASAGSARERDTYPHWSKLFKYALMSFSIDDIGRALVGERVLRPDMDATPGFPLVKPDFTLVDKGQALSDLWRHRAVFVEVKPLESQKPHITRDGTVSIIISQASTYARLHMSARPYQLFSVGLLIWGTHFAVAIFYRDVIRISPAKSVVDDFRTFIAVVRNLGNVLSDVELGQDPTVIQLSDEQTRELTGDDTPDVHPSYVLKPFSSIDSRWWCTIGAAIWSSVSLFGRGTLVYLARDYKPHDENDPQMGGVFGKHTVVLKTSWRSSRRNSESEIYETAREGHPGLAVYLIGDDAVGEDGQIVTAHHIRGEAVGEDVETRVLHRLLISSVGRPIWKYETDLELLKGLLAALDAHEWLFTKKNILHRDVSAGNILLALDPKKAPKGGEGFLADLDYARAQTIDLKEVRTVAPVRMPGRDSSGNPKYSKPDTSTKKVFGYAAAKRGALMTGTTQFMSVRALKAMRQYQDGVPKGTIGQLDLDSDFVHGPEDDVESFAYVLGYAVLRKTVETTTGDAQKVLKKAFEMAFASLNLDGIIRAREVVSPLSWIIDEKVEPYMDETGISHPLYNALVEVLVVLKQIRHNEEQLRLSKNPRVDALSKAKTTIEEVKFGYSEFREILSKWIGRIEFEEKGSK